MMQKVISFWELILLTYKIVDYVLPYLPNLFYFRMLLLKT